MRMEDKLAIYLRDKGIKHSWFAAKLGISGAFFTQILKGERPMPEKYWTLIGHFERLV